MYPAFSVILFTTASGAGYGLLAWIGALAPASDPAPSPEFVIASMITALGFVSLGLLASVFHLGRRKRMLMAFREWRTSWLSREAWAAVAVYPLAIIHGAGWLWPAFGPAANDEWRIGWTIAGVAMAAFALGTVLCTAMIYRSLPTIHQWHNHWVVPNYLAHAILSGALWLNAIAAPFGLAQRAMLMAAAALALGALSLKLAYWRFIDTTRHPATAPSALGLPGLSSVRQIEAPHTEENYLLREMGFRIARKHAAKLRRIAIVAAFVLPTALSLVGAWWQAIAAPAAVLAALGASLGLAVERWLFFAEARHVMILYYGAERA